MTTRERKRERTRERKEGEGEGEGESGRQYDGPPDGITVEFARGAFEKGVSNRYEPQTATALGESCVHFTDGERYHISIENTRKAKTVAVNITVQWTTEKSF